MDLLQHIIAVIDEEVAKPKNAKFGIRFSLDLFNVLVSAKMIEMTTFTVAETTAFPQQLPAYRRKNYAFIDLDLAGLEFEVGEPN